jgi:hypothetical protein
MTAAAPLGLLALDRDPRRLAVVDLVVDLARLPVEPFCRVVDRFADVREFVVFALDPFRLAELLLLDLVDCAMLLSSASFRC